MGDQRMMSFGFSGSPPLFWQIKYDFLCCMWSKVHYSLVEAMLCLKIKKQKQQSYMLR